MKSPSLKKVKGFTLLEVLIAIFLATGLMFLLFNNYLYIKNTHQLKVNLEQLAYKIQKAANILLQGIKPAGFVGCAKQIGDGEFIKVLGNEKSVKVRYMESITNQLVDQSYDHLQIKINGKSKIKALDPILISDCFNGEINKAAMVINDSVGQKIYLAKPLKFTYAKSAEVGRLITSEFYSAKNNRLEKESNHEALFKVDTKGIRHVIVEGLSNLQFNYQLSNNHRIIQKKFLEQQDVIFLSAIRAEFDVRVDDLNKHVYVFIPIVK